MTGGADLPPPTLDRVKRYYVIYAFKNAKLVIEWGETGRVLAVLALVLVVLALVMIILAVLVHIGNVKMMTDTISS